MLNLYETSIHAPLAISWDQSANNGVANTRSWPQWPNCYIFLVVQYFFHDGCSPVSIIIWCKNLQTSRSLLCFLSTPELRLLYFLLFFFFLGPWSTSQAICYCLWIHVHSNIGQFYFYIKYITRFPIWDCVHWEDFPSLFSLSVIKEAIMQLLSIFRLYSYTESIPSWTNLVLCLPPYVGYKSPLYCYRFEMGKISVLERHWWIKQGLWQYICVVFMDPQSCFSLILDIPLKTFSDSWEAFWPYSLVGLTVHSSWSTAVA